MAANTSPIFPGGVLIGTASLVTPTAVTTRTQITGTTNLTLLCSNQTNAGQRIDWIRVISAGTTSAALVFVWLYDGTNSYLIDEIVLNAVTPSNTSAGAKTDTYYANTGFNVPAGKSLYVSTTVSQNLYVHAFGGAY